MKNLKNLDQRELAATRWEITPRGIAHLDGKPVPEKWFVAARNGKQWTIDSVHATPESAQNHGRRLEASGVDDEIKIGREAEIREFLIREYFAGKIIFLAGRPGGPLEIGEELRDCGRSGSACR